MTTEIFGRYTIISEIGHGAMATVYNAKDRAMGRLIALKILRLDHIENTNVLNRFIREAKVEASMEHPSIVPVYDFNSDESPFIVMRLMQGGSLASQISKGPLTLSAAGVIMQRMCAALSFAHEQGIIHRDVKPANILFDILNNAYLADFGICHIGEATSKITHSGIIGTPAYISPEQVRPDLDFSPRSDIYSLAVTLFEMLSGQLPYNDANPFTVAMQHVQAPIPKITRYAPQLPHKLDKFFIKALAKNPDDRFETVDAFYNEYVQIISESTTKTKKKKENEAERRDNNIAQQESANEIITVSNDSTLDNQYVENAIEYIGEINPTENPSVQADFSINDLNETATLPDIINQGFINTVTSSDQVNGNLEDNKNIPTQNLSPSESVLDQGEAKISDNSNFSNNIQPAGNTAFTTGTKVRRKFWIFLSIGLAILIATVYLESSFIAQPPLSETLPTLTYTENARTSSLIIIPSATIKPTKTLQPTSSATITPAPTKIQTLTPTITNTHEPPSATPTTKPNYGFISGDTKCFMGPGTNYPITSTYLKDQKFIILGQSTDGNFYFVENAYRKEPTCFISRGALFPTNNHMSLPALTAMPIPTNAPIVFEVIDMSITQIAGKYIVVFTIKNFFSDPFVKVYIKINGLSGVISDTEITHYGFSYIHNDFIENDKKENNKQPLNPDTEGYTFSQRLNQYPVCANCTATIQLCTKNNVCFSRIIIIKP